MSATAIRTALAACDSRIARHDAGISLAEEAYQLAGDFKLFYRAAWPHVIPRPLTETWHLDTIAEHLQAAYEREIPRLIVTIQPGALKSSEVSVLAPAWRWTHAPEEQIVSASHTDTLATRDTRRTRSLLASTWFQARWPELELLPDENLKTRYTNTAGGYRVATHVGGGTGERGGVLILDDPHNASDATATTEVKLEAARTWIGDTWSSRLNISNDDSGVKIVIGQRVHENDVIGYLLDSGDDRWVHLCLPARYDRKHQFRYPAKVKLPSGRRISGDPRTKQGDLLAPAFMGEAQLADVQHDMSERTKEAQYQQNPTPREGAILKRADWRYFPKAFLNDGQRDNLPPFRMIVCSWDTSFKAKVTSDKVAGTAWGVTQHVDDQGIVRPGADHWLLATRNDRMSLQGTKDAMREMRARMVAWFPWLPVYVLIEKSSNGVEIVEQLEREIEGIIPITVSTDKKLRAEAASPALESHNVFLPGAMKRDGTGPDPAITDAEIMEAVEQAARFTGTGGEEDDWVDSFTQEINWVRTKDLEPSTVRAPTGRISSVQGIAQLKPTGITIRRTR